MKVSIINGPNISRLGARETIYGNFTYNELLEYITKYSEALGLEVDFFVSDIEGEIVKAIGDCKDDALIINAAAYSHYSIAIKDALAVYKGMKIECHLTNILAREQERKHSIIAENCDGIIAGFGADSYTLALNVIKLQLLREQR